MPLATYVVLAMLSKSCVSITSTVATAAVMVGILFAAVAVAVAVPPPTPIPAPNAPDTTSSHSIFNAVQLIKGKAVFESKGDATTHVRTDSNAAVTAAVTIAASAASAGDGAAGAVSLSVTPARLEGASAAGLSGTTRMSNVPTTAFKVGRRDDELIPAISSSPSSSSPGRMTLKTGTVGSSPHIGSHAMPAGGNDARATERSRRTLSEKYGCARGEGIGSEDAFWNCLKSYFESNAVRDVDLQRLELTYVPFWFGTVGMMPTVTERVMIGDNKISRLDASFASMTRLESIHAVNNNLAEMQDLGRVLGGIVNLRSLYLSGNGLKSVPTDLAALVNLVQLNLASNELTSMPEIFLPPYEPFDKLALLDLGFQDIGSFGDIEMAERFPALKYV